MVVRVWMRLHYPAMWEGYALGLGWIILRELLHWVFVVLEKCECVEVSQYEHAGSEEECVACRWEGRGGMQWALQEGLLVGSDGVRG